MRPLSGLRHRKGNQARAQQRSETGAVQTPRREPQNYPRPERMRSEDQDARALRLLPCHLFPSLCFLLSPLPAFLFPLAFHPSVLSSPSSSALPPAWVLSRPLCYQGILTLDAEAKSTPSALRSRRPEVTGSPHGAAPHPRPSPAGLGPSAAGSPRGLARPGSREVAISLFPHGSPGL